MKKRFKAEEIVVKVREAEAQITQGLPVEEVCRTLGISTATLVRWRQHYGGLSTDEAKRLRALEKENHRLRRTVADLALDKPLLPSMARRLPRSGYRRACHVVCATLEPISHNALQRLWQLLELHVQPRTRIRRRRPAGVPVRVAESGQLASRGAAASPE